MRASAPAALLAALAAAAASLPLGADASCSWSSCKIGGAVWGGCSSGYAEVEEHGCACAWGICAGAWRSCAPGGRTGAYEADLHDIDRDAKRVLRAGPGGGGGGGLLIVALKTLKTYKRLAKPPCHRARRGNDFAPRPLVPDSPNHRLLRPTHPPTFRRARAGTSHKCCDCDVYPNLSGCDECGFFDVSCNWAVISADIFPNGVSDAIKGAAIADRPRSEHSAHTGLCHHRPRLTKSASPLSCDR